MLEKSGSLLLDELGNHIAQDGANGIESLVSSADVVQAVVVEQDLLDDEDGDCLAQLRAGFHDAQAKRNDLSREEKVNHLSRIILYQCANDTEGGQAEILERTGFRSGVQEGVEEQRDVGYYNKPC